MLLQTGMFSQVTAAFDAKVAKTQSATSAFADVGIE